MLFENTFAECVIQGRLTSNPRQKTLSYDNDLRHPRIMVTFSLAVNKQTKNPRGEWEQGAEFFDAICYDQINAGHLLKHCKKGDLIKISGQLSFKKTDRDGQTKFFISVKVSPGPTGLQIILSKQDRSEEPYQNKQERTPVPYTDPYNPSHTSKNYGGFNDEIEDDEIPF